MLPERLDTLFALKVVALDRDLSGTEKRVMAAILESYNRKTGRCDRRDCRCLQHCSDAEALLTEVQAADVLGLSIRTLQGLANETYRPAECSRWPCDPLPPTGSAFLERPEHGPLTRPVADCIHV